VAVGQEADEDRFEELAVGDDCPLDLVQDGVALVTRAGDVHGRFERPAPFSAIG